MEASVRARMIASKRGKKDQGGYQHVVGDRMHKHLFVRHLIAILSHIRDAERTHPSTVVPFLAHKNTWAHIHTHKVRMFYFLGEAVCLCDYVCVSVRVCWCVLVCFCVFLCVHAHVCT